MINDLQECYETLEKENTLLRESNSDLNDKLDLLSVLKLKYHQRRNNLRFDGIDEAFGETNLDCYRVIEVLQHIMDTTNVRIARCHRLGPYRRNGTRLIIANFHWSSDIIRKTYGDR